MIYELTAPPEGQRCCTPGDGNMASVRLLVPQADGKTPFDLCDLCTPRILGTCRRMGHEIVDTSGSLRLLAAEFPGWRIFTSDQGRLYASARLRGPQGQTVYAWTVRALRAEIESAEQSAAQNTAVI